jgi:iron-sulfur cluster assembly protein
MARRPRPQVVNLTEAAAERVKAILAESGKAYLRVGVSNGGCAGMEYLMEYADTPEPLDEIVEDKGVKMLIKANAVLFLIGSTIDFSATRLSQKFTFTNPNQTDACGCGESVTIVPAKEEA